MMRNPQIQDASNLASLKTVEFIFDSSGLSEFEKDLIKTEAELRLRKAGIPVVTEQKFDYGFAFVYVQVQLLTNSVCYGGQVDLDVHQWAPFPRFKDTIELIIWQAKGMTVLGPVATKVEEAQVVVDAQLDAFILAWMRSHPKS